ncbi:MAG: hypothetical protein OXM56_07190, partial [Gammaproteobacteria bacterium]|nr:hypothetical protein [Gammaproteobacteria bacterium]
MGLGDFNGDGRADLLLRHVNQGAWLSYEMNAGVRGVLRRVPLTRNLAFGLEGIGDLGDGVVGLFSGEGNVKGGLVVRIADPTSETVTGHLDLTEVTVHETNEGRNVIVEFTLREPIPEPGEDEHYSYRVYVDVEEPHWTQFNTEDLDLYWGVELRAGQSGASGGTLLPRQEARRVALLADTQEL